MSVLELEDLAAAPDTLPYCPVKLAELEEMFTFSPFIPIIPVPVNDPGDYPSPRFWQYRVCGI